MRHPVAHAGKPPLRAPLFAVLAIAAATLFSSAGPASAGSGYGQLIVNPGTASAGQTVSILGVCPTNGSTLSGVTSTAFVGGSASITLGSENFTGTATISGSVSPGSYVVTAECGSGSPSVDITVTSGGGSPTTAPVTVPATTQPAQPSPTVTHSSAPPMMSSAPAPMSSSTRMGASSTPTGGMMSPSGMSSASSSSIAAVGFPADTTATPAPAVTSTGVIRVGLAGQSSQLSTVLAPALLAGVFAIACAVGFLLHRRRRHSAASHN